MPPHPDQGLIQSLLWGALKECDLQSKTASQLFMPLALFQPSEFQWKQGEGEQ